MQDSLKVLLVSAGFSGVLPSSQNGDQDIRPVVREWHFHVSTGIGESRLFLDFNDPLLL